MQEAMTSSNFLSPRVLMQLTIVAILLLTLSIQAHAYPTNHDKRWDEPRLLSICDGQVEIPTAPSDLFTANPRGTVAYEGAGLRRRTGASGTETATAKTNGSGAAKPSNMAAIVGGIAGSILGVVNIGIAFIIIRKHYQRMRAREEADLLRAAAMSPTAINEPSAYYYEHAHSAEYTHPFNTKMSGGLINSQKSAKSELSSEAGTIAPPFSSHSSSTAANWKVFEVEKQEHSIASSPTLTDSNWSRAVSIALPPTAMIYSQPKTPSHSGANSPVQSGPDRSFMFWD